MPSSGATANVNHASRQGGLVTDGDFMMRRGVPGFEARPFAHNRPGAQIKPYTGNNKHFSTSHKATIGVSEALFLQDAYKRETMSKVLWGDIYGKTHGPHATRESRELSSRPNTASSTGLAATVRPNRVTPDYNPTFIEKRRKLLDLCYNSNLVLGTMPEAERFGTTYGQLCAEAGSTKERMKAIKGQELSTASIKHYDVFTHKQSLDPLHGRTRFPITSSPGITEFLGPRDCNAIRAWHEFSTSNYR
ncbi:hypothetical protein T492DRAFT_974465 [Pavlovales sp. CCMP2436]|nr:hypothetical protein T492DRAFT_974465 [Pavlovales sp. CCMP2436]|mmetsp:Transcript_32846/g.81618  ORF Transcript_32846/g.81618 Transcript_32846/m.81618 type:complete len:248 (+) Transcript_32846:99-842(+)